jgi:hypothetical protein
MDIAKIYSALFNTIVILLPLPADVSMASIPLNLARDLNNDFFIEEITFIIIFKIGLSFIDTRCKLKITFL